jgi:hypothetical protein
MDKSDLHKPRRRFHTIPGWCEYSQMSRTSTYNAVGRGELKAVKLGNRTLIDAEVGDDYLDHLPAAEIRAPRERHLDYPTPHNVAGQGAPRSKIKAYEVSLPPSTRHRLRMERKRESDEEPTPT